VIRYRNEIWTGRQTLHQQTTNTLTQKNGQQTEKPPQGSQYSTRQLKGAHTAKEIAQKGAHGTHTQRCGPKGDDTHWNRSGSTRGDRSDSKRGRSGSKRDTSQQSHISRPLKGNFQPTQKLKN
jgi:hypothetical protein